MKCNFDVNATTDIEKYRCSTLETKEPETLKWIQSFKDGDCLYDVGANIGLYSLYCCSINPNTAVYSFEPMISNFTKMLCNKDMNKFANMNCIYAACGAETRLASLYVPNQTFLRQGLTPGASGSQLDKAEDESGNAFPVLTVHNVQCFTLDDFINIFKAEIPQHIKIDTDGNEGDILKGFTKWDSVKSVLVEWNKQKNPDLLVNMEALKFTSDNEFNKLENHSRHRQPAGIENVIFTRPNGLS